jgi:dolichol-phosphate mannosyltransferase
MSHAGVVVIPAYNEEQALPAFIPRLCEFLAAQREATGAEVSVLVVDDGSTDGTVAALEKLAQGAGPGVVGFISLTRNFGHQAAVVAGMLHASATADFVITMDADGEHPFTLIPELVARWREGAAIVHTARRPNSKLPFTKRVASAGYYWLFARLSGLAVRPGMADFKLWDGELLREVAPALPNCGSTRAFASWLAPRGPVVGFDQHVVEGRRSRFTSRKMWSLAIGAIVRYSDLPLRFSILVGVVALLFAATLTAFVLWAVLTGRTVPGWASMILTITVFGALQSFAIGILGEYLLRNWFRQSLPKFVVRRRPSPKPSPKPSEPRA